jgi:hypothetical protein
VQNKGKSVFKKEIQLARNANDIYYDLSFWLNDTILQKELVIQANIKTDTLFYFAVGDPMVYLSKGNINDALKPYSYILVETDMFEYMDEKKTSKTIYEGYNEITYNKLIRTIRTNRTDWSSRKMNFDYRKIEGIEKVTTKAGTWTCYKIVNKDTQAKGMYKNISLVDYFAPGFGLLKTESYYKKRMVAYSEISKVY